MTTITVWLLVAFGYRNDLPQVLERLPTQAECARVMHVIFDTTDRPYTMRCIEARVARP